MPKSKDPRVERAAFWFSANPNMRLAEAMRAAGFSDDEARNKAWQMIIRRSKGYVKVKDKLPGSIKIFSQPIGSSTVSSLTNSVENETNGGTTKRKRIRRLSHQVQTERNNKRLEKEKTKKAHKVATSMFDRERKKRKGIDSPQKGVRAVADIVNQRYGTSINYRTIARYCKNGLVGVSPLSIGERGTIPELVLSHLVTALESYIGINQANGHGLALRRKTLVHRVNNTVATLSSERTSDKLFIRLLKRGNIDLSSKVHETIEDRRHRWTTYSNLKLWFENWGKDLVQLGFAQQDENEKCIISDDQLSRIINIDES